MKRLLPKTQAPDLNVQNLKGEDIQLKGPQRFTLVVFFRGGHSDECGQMLRELSHLKPLFDQANVSCVAISADDRSSSQHFQKKWGLENLNIAAELKIDIARRWGLFITAGNAEDNEPEVFCEPAVFALGATGEVFASSVCNMSFVRPRFEDWLVGLLNADEKKLKTRGNF